MPYVLKSFMKYIEKKIDIGRQYKKFISICFKEKNYIKIFSCINAHFKNGINPLLYSYYRLESVSKSEWGEYIIDQKEFNKLLNGYSSVEDRRSVGNKLTFYKQSTLNGLPIIPVCCVLFYENKIREDGLDFVNNLYEWRKVCKKLPDEMFIKPILGASGKGSFSVCKNKEKYILAGLNFSSDDFFNYLKERLGFMGGFMVQPRMRTHSSLRCIVSSQGLSTIRVATLRRGGKSEIIMACLKIIRGENDHDNFSKGMSKNLIAPLNTATGELDSAWGSLRSDWPQMVQHAIHPDFGSKIKGFVLPQWKEISELALKAQDSVPALQTIGWDIALTDDGIFIVEANTAYDAASFQLFEKRGMKREFHGWFNSSTSIC